MTDQDAEDLEKAVSIFFERKGGKLRWRAKLVLLGCGLTLIGLTFACADLTLGTFFKMHRWIWS